MRMADGHWAPEDLRWFDSLIVSLPNSNQPIIFVTHYPLDEEHCITGMKCLID